MTYKEKYDTASNWKSKILLMNIYHNIQVYTSKDNWRIEDTAKYFHVSKGLVSENLNLAKNMDIVEDCTSRKGALNKLKENNNGNKI